MMGCRIRQADRGFLQRRMGRGEIDSRAEMEQGSAGKAGLMAKAARWQDGLVPDLAADTGVVDFAAEAHGRPYGDWLFRTGNRSFHRCTIPGRATCSSLSRHGLATFGQVAGKLACGRFDNRQNAWRALHEGISGTGAADGPAGSTGLLHRVEGTPDRGGCSTACPVAAARAATATAGTSGTARGVAAVDLSDHPPGAALPRHVDLSRRAWQGAVADPGAGRWRAGAHPGRSELGFAPAGSGSVGCGSPMALSGRWRPLSRPPLVCPRAGLVRCERGHA